MDSGDEGSTKSVFGVPSLIRKKNRYTDEDFSFSPPADETGFFHLRFGVQSHKAPESMYDRINRELGLTIETSMCHVTSNGNKEYSKSADGTQTPVIVGTEGIVLETATSQTKIPLSVVFDKSSEASNLSIPGTIQERRESVEFDLPSEDYSFLQKKSENLSKFNTEISRKSYSSPPTRKTSLNLADTLQHFNISSSHVDSTSTLTTSDSEYDCSTSTTNTISTVSVKQERQRKVSAPPSLNPMVMGPQKSQQFSNFFFTGGLFSSSATSSPTLNSECPQATSNNSLLMKQSSHIAPSQSEPASPIMQRPEGSDSRILQHYTQKMEERTKEAESFDPKPKMGKRRPKPSVLREMNFWAPQSM